MKCHKFDLKQRLSESNFPKFVVKQKINQRKFLIIPSHTNEGLTVLAPFDPIPTRGKGGGRIPPSSWFFAHNFWNYYRIDLKFGHFS